MAENNIYSNLREFVSPNRQYFWQECCVRDGQIYQCINPGGTSGRWIETDWQIVSVTDFADQYNELKNLVGKVLEALVNNGIKITDEDLLIELENNK